jgi:flagellar biosynthetic protein FliO
MKIRIGPILAAAAILMTMGLGTTRAQTFDTDSFMGKLRHELSGYDSSAANHDTAAVHARGLIRKQTGSLTWTVLKVTLYLFIVVVAIIGVAWLFKKGGIAGSSKVGGGGAMEIVEALGTGRERTVLLVRVVDTIYLLGQTANSISVIDKFEGQKALEVISQTRGGVSIAKFKDVFNQFMEKFKK